MKLLIVEDDLTSRAMQESCPNLTLISCSGYGDQIDVTGARALGMCGYVSKPPDTPSFLEPVESLL